MGWAQEIGKRLGAGPEAGRLWFTTMLEYSLVATVADQYLDFAQIGAACLRLVASNHGVELSESEAKEAGGDVPPSSAGQKATADHLHAPAARSASDRDWNLIRRSPLA